MVATCKPKKHKDIDDIIVQGKVKVDKSNPKTDMDDTDARLIDALGNLDKVEFVDKDGNKIDVDLNGPLEGCRFRIKIKNEDSIENMV